MIVYKAFRPGLRCLGYQFSMGINTTKEANCRKNGFHCAENPLDCLTYYPYLKHSGYFIVDAKGDIHEEGTDTKISCTELHILKEISHEELFLLGLAYMHDHPKRPWSPIVCKDRSNASAAGYAVVRGTNPTACGAIGDILAFAQEDASGNGIINIAVTRVDGQKIKPNVWYRIEDVA